MPTCPNCGRSGWLFYAASWCAVCGWHKPGTTTQHANFAPAPACVWCETTEQEQKR